MSNKFVSTLTASDASIKATRAKQLSESASIETEALVSGLRREKLALESKISAMTDLAPDNSFSLRPGAPDFNAAKWVKELHEARMDLKLKQIELDEANSIYTEWFAEPATSEATA